MQIAILGTGAVGRTLAAGVEAAGHAVVLGSRTPVDRDLPFAVASHEDAVGSADIVVSAVQAAHAEGFLSGLADRLFDGKVLVDLGNAVTPDFQLMYPNASLGQAIQETLPGARVVKALNTVAAPLMADPGRIGSSDVFLSGDDTDAKASVSRFLESLGWPTRSIVDLGGIATARGPEHYFALFAALMQVPGAQPFNIRVVRGE